MVIASEPTPGSRLRARRVGLGAGGLRNENAHPRLAFASEGGGRWPAFHSRWVS